MKSILAILLFASIVPAAAQTAADSAKPAEVTTIPTSNPYVLRVGPTIGIYTGAINTTETQGRKVNPDMWFLQNYGVMVFAPFTKGSKMGGRLDLGISTVGTQTRPYEFYDLKTDWDGYFIERYTYFTIAPTLSLYGIMIGAGFNIPMKGEMWNPNRSDDVFAVDKTTLKTAIDLRAGAAISVWSSDLGVLTVDILAEYFVSGLYNEGMYTNGHAVGPQGLPDPKYSDDPVSDVVPVSLTLGLSYQFKLGF